MMSKYVVVSQDQVPTTLRPGEYVINTPDFLEEIRGAQARQHSRRKLTTASYLRSIGNMIAISYDPTFNALTQLHAHSYEGREFNNESELSAIVLEMLQNDYPQIFDKYLDHKIKNRPLGTKLIYFTGHHTQTGPFFMNGFDGLDLKDVDVFLGLKQKKTVGKPAVSNDETHN